MINFVHSGNAGDIIYSLPTVISILKENNMEKANFYLKIDQPAQYYTGSDHPLIDVRLNKKFAEQLMPLLESQSYINEAKIYEDEHIDVDLDEFRDLEIDQSQGYIARWYFYAFMADYDLSKSWINVEPNTNFKNCIVINRTFRYKNLLIDYSFLRKYENIVFVGLEQEYKNFSESVPNSKFVTCDNFLQIAQIIAGCRLFIGNQSFAFSLAEAIKVPRVLEICPFAPNIIPHGFFAYDFHTQIAFETIIKKVVNV